MDTVVLVLPAHQFIYEREFYEQVKDRQGLYYAAAIAAIAAVIIIVVVINVSVIVIIKTGRNKVTKR